MNIHQVEQFFKDKENVPCPLTERLIKAGYQQTGDGYIKIAKSQGLTVDHTKAEPTQYWHLVEENTALQKMTLTLSRFHAEN